MNRQADADELNVAMESLLAGGKIEMHGKWRALAALAAELRELPNPEFKSRLKAELVEEYPLSVARTAAFEQVTGAAAFAEILPSLGGSNFRIFPADHRSFLVSFVSHTALIVLIASGIWVGGRPIIKSIATTPEVTYLPTSGGGGGSGDHSPIPATKGTPPKMSEQQLAPATIVVRRSDPMLPVEPPVVGPPDVKLPQSEHIGDLISSNVVIPSNGSGNGGGAGSGSETGLGGGTGLGYGPGSNIGTGGGVFAMGHGITAPRAIYDPEPEYSDEARRVKHQGVVILSLVVDQQGRPRDIHVARSLGMGLDQKAIEAVTKWKFSPGMKDGIPVAVRVNIEVSFRLY
jgi:periplasmic protein TonB